MLLKVIAGLQTQSILDLCIHKMYHQELAY